MKRFVNEHYFNQTSNRILILYIAIVFIDFLMIIIHKLNNPLYLIVTFCLNVFFSFALPIIFHIFTKNQKREQSDLIQLKEVIEISRENRLCEIKNRQGLYILTGESGIGKTYLLKELMSKNKKCKYTSNYYSECNAKYRFKEYNGYRYIIFDQFERAFNGADKQLKKLIVQLINNDNCLVIIAVKKEYFGDTYNLFRKHIDNNVMWLKYSKSEIEEIERKLSEAFKDRADKNALYLRIMEDIKKQSITFIQLSLLYQIIKESRSEFLSDFTISNSESYDNIISDFYKKALKEYKEHELAFQILYLLCCDTRSEFISTVQDFMNISLRQADSITGVLQYLIGINLITSSGENNAIKLSDSFEISHDYFYSIIQALCIEEINVDIQNNIDYYKNYIQQKRHASPNKKIETTSRIVDRFISDNTRKNSSLFLKSSLVLVSFLIAVLNIILVCHYLKIDDGMFSWIEIFSNYFSFHSEQEILWALAFVNILVILSVLYIYNFSLHFLQVFKIIHNVTGKRSYFHLLFYLIVFAGCICCCLSMIIIEAWAILLGIEVLLVSVCLLIIRNCCNNQSKKVFTKLFISTILSSMLILLFGFCYKYFSIYNYILCCSFFVLYGAFIGMCIFSHINRSKMLSLCGSVIYNVY